ncbi:hypothetical protein HDU93_004690 [Gonapodya sp. JEL0774]|nr:hypothetical protein HDU93_004690 [Gonapodya sp. JEL0774]
MTRTVRRRGRRGKKQKDAKSSNDVDLADKDDNEALVDNADDKGDDQTDDSTIQNPIAHSDSTTGLDAWAQRGKRPRHDIDPSAFPDSNKRQRTDTGGVTGADGPGGPPGGGVGGGFQLRHALPIDFFGKPSLELASYFAKLESLIKENQVDREDEDALPTLISSAYASLEGHELPLFADPVTSRAVECVVRFSDDWQLRVLMDRVGGRFFDLFRQQFASHVCQTLLLVAADVMERELCVSVLVAGFGPGSNSASHHGRGGRGPVCDATPNSPAVSPPLCHLKTPTPPQFLVPATEFTSKLKGESSVEHQGEPSGGDVPSMTNSFLKVCENLAPHTIPLLRDRHASHPLRTILGILSGLPITPDSSPSSAKTTTKRPLHPRKSPSTHLPPSPASLSRVRSVPPTFSPVLAKMLDPVVMASDAEVRDLCVHVTASPAMQVAVEAGEAGRAVVERIVDVGDGIHDPPTPFFPTLLTHPTASHLAEKILLHTSYTHFAFIFNRDLAGRVVLLARDGVGNYVAQKVVARAEGKELEACVEEVGKAGAEIWFTSRRPALVLALTTSVATRGSPALQRTHLAHLASTFGCDPTANSSSTSASTTTPTALAPDRVKDLAYCMVSGKRWGMWCTESGGNTEDMGVGVWKVDSYGCSVAAQVIAFVKDAGKGVIEGLLSLPPPLLISLPVHPSGSRLVESIFKSANVPRSGKKQFATKIESKWVQYAMDKFGSHVVEAWWGVAGWEDKNHLASLLQPHLRKLSQNHCGVFVARNLGLEDRLRDPRGWTETWKGRERRREMFKEIVGEEKAGKHGSKAEESESSTRRFYTPGFGFVEVQRTVQNAKDNTVASKRKLDVGQRTHDGDVNLPAVDEEAVQGLLAGTSLVLREKTKLNQDGKKEKKKEKREKESAEEKPDPAAKDEIDALFSSSGPSAGGKIRKDDRGKDGVVVPVGTREKEVSPEGLVKRKKKKGSNEKDDLEESNEPSQPNASLTSGSSLLANKGKKKRKAEEAERELDSALAISESAPVEVSAKVKRKSKDVTEVQELVEVTEATKGEADTEGTKTKKRRKREKTQIVVSS